MADIELVIKLPKEDYDDIMLTGENTINLGILLDLRKAVRNGKPLPKGHGALKDADEIKKNRFTLGTSNYCEYKVVKIEDIDKANTIIEADKGNE